MSRRSRLTLALSMAGATLFLTSAALATPQAAAVPTPTQVAKAPATAPVATPTPAAKVQAPASPAPFKLAQLDYPVPPTASAADLLQVADDYAAQGDFAGARQALQTVVSSRPGTKEAGWALGLLADEYASLNDTARADAFTAQLADYEAEVQAYAALCRTAYPAQRAGQMDVYEKTLTDFIAQWKGTASAGRAALSLGDCYRFIRLDYPQAIATFRNLSTDYAGTLTGEEALVALAETLDWSVPSHHEEAQEVFAQALDTVHYPGLQVRCVIGLADLLTKFNAADQAYEALSQLIAAYPSHPSVGHAYTLRSFAAERLGNWDQCVSDARAFLAHPILGTFAVARAHLVLGKDAYRRGHAEEATTEFTAASQLAEADNHVTETSDLGGPAQVGLAALAADRGDRRAALQCLLKGADLVTRTQLRATYLFQAAEAAQQLHDDTTRTQIIARMTAEMPGHRLTTKLVGHELLPAPEI